jgi:hypothetical protein
VADGNVTKYRAVKQTVVHMLPLSRDKLPIECIDMYYTVGTVPTAPVQSV